MCGIVGLVSPTPVTPPEVLVAMRDAMIHRGPDDAGVWWSADRRVGLAHRRLSIIDPSPAGHQPMADASGRLQLVFNGEIYNYLDLREELSKRGWVFRSASDTETILAAYQTWGTECLSHLNGMFAFALYDAEARRLFMARDRAGEKPLFYAEYAGRFGFASELKALMADPQFPRQLDLASLESYLAYGYVPGAACMLKGVHKLPPAHALTLDVETREARVWCYWRLPEPAVETNSAEDLSRELRQLLEDSVRRQLCADVPVGILLSGGVDSSLITAMAARVSPKPVKTFTIIFPGAGSYNEEPYARLVADYFGTDHTTLVVQPAAVELLPVLARQYDEPMCDSSMLPTFLLSRLIRQHATVALSGDGGDELFGGYQHHSLLFHQDRIVRMLPRLLRQAIASGAANYLPVGLRGRNYLLGMGGGLPQAIAHISMFFDAQARQRLLTPLRGQELDSARQPEAMKIGLLEAARGLPGQSMALDFHTFLPEDILVKVDRASMLTSLEVRAPWLDYRIIEFAFRRVPNHLRATVSARKILLRRLAERLLPPAGDWRRKQGFCLPLKQWFRGEWGRYVAQVLQEADARLFEPRMIQSLLDSPNRTRVDNQERLFALTLFELWRREYRVALP